MNLANQIFCKLNVNVKMQLENYKMVICRKNVYVDILNIFLIIVIIIYPASILLSAFFDLTVSNMINIAIPSIIALGIVILIIKSYFMYCEANKKRKIKKMNNIFKNNIIKELLYYYNPSFQYYINDGISREELLESDIILDRAGDKYVTSDLLIGFLPNKMKFKMAKIVKEKIVENEREIENLILAIVDLPKNTNVNITICSGYKEFGHTKKRMSIDSPEFNQKFEIYSNNEIVLYQILTTDVMEKFLSFDKSFNITVKNNKIYMSTRELNNLLFSIDVYNGFKPFSVDDINYSVIELTKLLQFYTIIANCIQNKI